MIYTSFDNMDDKITYEDVREYEKLFTLAPSFLLERFARKNSNLVLKFKSAIESHINRLTDEQMRKLNIMLESDVEDLQSVMHEAYTKTRIKQYKVLANPKYKDFIEYNLDEIRKLIK